MPERFRAELAPSAAGQPLNLGPALSGQTHQRAMRMIPARPLRRHNPRMKTLAGLLAAGCCVLMSVNVLADGAPDALRDVEGVERARFKAFVAADTKSLEQMLSSDLVYCHSTGQCQNKDEVVAAIGSHQTIYHALDV